MVSSMMKIEDNAAMDGPVGSEGEPDHCDHRQPDGEGRAKGGSTLDASGYDAGKKVVGRKRHVLTDTMGLLLGVVVHPANMQDRDGAEPLLRQARRLFPFVERTIGWISRNRHLARDFERHCRIACAFVRMAMIRIMLRRLTAKHSP